MKTCRKCLVEKPVGEFYVDASKPQKVYIRPYCKDCDRTKTAKYIQNHKTERAVYNREYSRNYRRRQQPARCDPNRDRSNYLKRLYGITVDQYNEMLSRQGGLCAICGSEGSLEDRFKYLSVDHDHTNGTVRGLLCRHCNLALGHVFDSPEIAAQLVAYLQQ